MQYTFQRLFTSLTHHSTDTFQSNPTAPTSVVLVRFTGTLVNGSAVQRRASERARERARAIVLMLQVSKPTHTRALYDHNRLMQPHLQDWLFRIEHIFDSYSTAASIIVGVAVDIYPSTNPPLERIRYSARVGCSTYFTGNCFAENDPPLYAF